MSPTTPISVTVRRRDLSDTKSRPRFPRRHEDVVRVQHVLPELAVLRVPRRAQTTGEMFLPTALESQMFHQIVPHYVRSAALVAGERSHLPVAAARAHRWTGFQLCKTAKTRT